MDEVLCHITPVGQGKYAVSVCTFLGGINAIKSHLHFTSDDWRFDINTRDELQKWILRCVEQGRLIDGIWRESLFVTLHTLRKLTVGWFKYVLGFGSRGFDLDPVKVLPLAMMVAVDCRVGDCVSSDCDCTINGKSMRLEDIQLALGGESEDVTNVVADVTLKYEKGQKWVVPLP